MNTQLVDQKARDMAQAALSKMDTHEQVCMQRWQSAMDTMADIKRIIAWGGATLIAAMASIILILATTAPK